MNTEEMIVQTLQSIQNAIDYICNCMISKQFDEYKKVFEDVYDAAVAVNVETFQNEEIEMFVLSIPTREEDVPTMLEVYSSWIGYVKKIVGKRKKLNNYIDKDFYQLIDYVCNVDYKIIVDKTIQCLLRLDEKTKHSLNWYYQKYHHFWGNLDISGENYEVIEKRVSVLKERNEELVWLYEKLGDYRSKNVLRCMLYSWITFDSSFISQMKEANFFDYYDLDLVNCDDDEVVVDLGAYNGDSILDYMDVYGKYKRIYCYEITPKTVEELRSNLSSYSNIEIRNKGAGKQSDVMYLSSEEALSNNTISKGNNGTPIDIVAIDDDVEEAVTLIKMDIEGAETDALLGCKRHIQNEKPKLLVCVYHSNDDIWKIPQLIANMREDYTFYLRSNGNQWGPSEIVLFAL